MYSIHAIAPTYYSSLHQFYNLSNTIKASFYDLLSIMLTARCFKYLRLFFIMSFLHYNKQLAITLVYRQHHA